MRVLILTVSSGQGHNMCAKAVSTALEDRGAETRVVDTITYINEWVGKQLDKTYLGMSKHTPDFWKWVYTTGVKISERSYSKNHPLKLPYIPQRFRQLVQDYDPNVVVCTHVFASLLISKLRQDNGLTVPVIGVNTDFTLHPFWEMVEQDYIVLAGKGMDYAVEKRGISQDKILPIGLPVDPKFNTQIEMKEARTQLGLEEKPTLLLMSGSMGYGDIGESVKKLDVLPMDFQMVVICGNNEKMRTELEDGLARKEYQKNIRVLGFVDNVHEYMCAADMVCTKPGGLSVSESMNLRRPIVLTEPIPGLEELNAVFLVNNGVAVQSSKPYPLDEAIFNLMRNPERRHQIIEAQSKMTPGHAAEHLADFILERQSIGQGEES